jgi:hypothetical protein
MAMEISMAMEEGAMLGGTILLSPPRPLLSNHSNFSSRVAAQTLHCIRQWRYHIRTPMKQGGWRFEPDPKDSIDVEQQTGSDVLTTSSEKKRKKVLLLKI